MTKQELKNQVDKLWTEFWVGGITNPLMVIEQISFLMFARLLDIREAREEKKAKRTKKPFRRIYSKGKQVPCTIVPSPQNRQAIQTLRIW
jgi:type I restriction enzyme M protein